MEHESKPLAGGLYVAATPIGNLADITLRVLDSLKQADLILAEDTRKTNQLLNHYKIKNKLKSFRVHQLKKDIESTITELLAGKSVVFVTDAGTPGISDPVSHLVRQIRERKLPIPITALPGASALTAALSISGWQVNPTLFAGFLSPKSGKRRKSIEQMLQFDGLIVIYESVHRIDKLLAELVEIHPNRPILVTRELTKLHQECIEVEPGGPIPDFVRKGEFTVILGEIITKK